MTSDDHKTALRAPDVDLLGCGDAIGRRHLQSKTAASGRCRYACPPASPPVDACPITNRSSCSPRRATSAVCSRGVLNSDNVRSEQPVHRGKGHCTIGLGTQRGLDAGDPVEHGRALRATAPAPHSRFAARRRARLDAHVLVAAHNQIHNFAAPRGRLIRNLPRAPMRSSPTRFDLTGDSASCPSRIRPWEASGFKSIRTV